MTLALLEALLEPEVVMRNTMQLLQYAGQGIELRPSKHNPRLAPSYKAVYYVSPEDRPTLEENLEHEGFKKQVGPLAAHYTMGDMRVHVMHEAKETPLGPLHLVQVSIVERKLSESELSGRPSQMSRLTRRVYNNLLRQKPYAEMCRSFARLPSGAARIRAHVEEAISLNQMTNLPQATKALAKAGLDAVEWEKIASAFRR